MRKNKHDVKLHLSEHHDGMDIVDYYETHIREKGAGGQDTTPAPPPRYTRKSSTDSMEESTVTDQKALPSKTPGNIGTFQVRIKLIDCFDILA